jgi:hypothetical protein
MLFLQVLDHEARAERTNDRTHGQGWDKEETIGDTDGARVGGPNDRTHREGDQEETVKEDVGRDKRIRAR